MYPKQTILLAALVFFVGCASQESLYKKAVQDDSIDSYQEFIQKYPDTKYSEEARKNLMALEFKNAQKANSVSQYEKFLQKYPGSKYSEEARENLMTLEFMNAEKTNSVSQYEKFLQKYPDTKYSEEARKNLMALEFKNAQKANSVSQYEKFLLKYPNSEFSDEAKENVENELNKLSYQDYTSASINTGPYQYKKVKVKNLILMRVIDKKTRSKQGYPVMSPSGSFLIENGEVKIDKSKEAYYINYFAINGQDIREINSNSISIHTSKNIYKLSIVDDNPKLNDSFLINRVVMNLLDQSKSFNKETALLLGFSWFEKLRNGDFVLFARKTFQTSYGIPNVGVLSLSTIDEKTLTGNILGQLLFDGEKYFVESTIQVIESNTGEIIKIDL